MMADDDVRIPETIPVMVLGGATLFPHGYMPLFIFEMKYRAMLNFSLERDRMFAIGHARPGVDTDTSPDPVHRVTTVGLVRACVTHPDGTSHLMLSGIHRAEILGWEQHSPFRIASIVPLPCYLGNPKAAAVAALELVDLSGRLCGEGKLISEQLREHLRCVKDPTAIADVVGQSFLNDPDARQQLLEMSDVNERLDYLVNHLSLLVKDSG